MPKERPSIQPRNFFLNEQHELSRGEKESGGRLPALAPLDWQKKGRRIHKTLAAARETIDNSRDPLRKNRYFLATLPSKKIRKTSKDAQRAPDGIVEESTDYAGDHSRVFRRLGLDLLAVDSEGRALVHAPATRVEQLLKTADGLSSEGLREQARWVAIDAFDPAPPSFRVDEQWLSKLPARGTLDAVVELQPLLTRVEVEQVIQAIVELIAPRGDGEKFTRTGTDFSGRHWYRGVLSRESLRSIAKEFFSVQALHPPLSTPITVASSRRGPTPRPVGLVVPVQVDASALPVVGVVDVGIPSGHAQLAQFRRGGYTSPDVPPGLVSDHASRVASRVVYGDVDFSTGIGQATGGCAFIDVNVASDAGHVDDKALLPALQAVVGAYPDIRVFNLSFGEFAPLAAHPPVERREKLLLVQDLDNFAFRSDSLIVVAAGNSPPGLVPEPKYPDHVDDSQWALGSWACGFNTIKCGSYVGRLTPNGLVKNLGWPSPFTRIGPGLCEAPVPEFSASGGNCSERFQSAPGMGVWTLSASGNWEDHAGTSFAAPLLAREAAFLFAELQRRCEQGARPFASTVKAYLALTAMPPPSQGPENLVALIKRTLGRGTGESQLLRSPRPESAVLIWQGVLNNADDKARIQIPIPQAWLGEASAPCLRVLAAWEAPVNLAVEHVWASRKLEFQLRTTASSKAIHPRGKSHPSYPLLDRTYRLGADALAKGKHAAPTSDFWVLEVSYQEIAEYAATIEFSPHQRVGIAMELFEDSEAKESPQSSLQALPTAVTMTRLTVPENRIANPIVLRPRI